MRPLRQPEGSLVQLGREFFNAVFVVVSLLCGKEENVLNFAPIIKWILPHKPLRGFNEG